MNTVSEYGRTIRAPGVFIPRQIETDRRVPDWFHADDQTGQAGNRLRVLLYKREELLEQKEQDPAEEKPEPPRQRKNALSAAERRGRARRTGAT